MLSKFAVLCSALLVLLVASVAQAEKKPADGDKSAEAAAKEDLPAAIDNGIKLLEAEKSGEFLERYILPADLEKLKKSNQLDAVKEEFKKDHSADVLKVLKAVKDAKPEMSEEGELATFDVSKLEGKHPDKLHFRKIKDVWYIAEK